MKVKPLSRAELLARCRWLPVTDGQAVPPPADAAGYEPFVAASGERDVQLLQLYTAAELDEARAQAAAAERERIIAELRNRATSERDEAITTRSPNVAHRHMTAAASLDAAADLLEGDTDDQ